MRRWSVSVSVVAAAIALAPRPCLCQNPNPDVDLLALSKVSADSDLWKAFRQEMKTLEEAAHRVNNLLSGAEGGQGQGEGEATVLVTAPPPPPPPQPAPTGATSPQPLNGDPELSHLSLSSLFNSFRSFTHFPEPWWKGENVCIQKTEQVEDKDGGQKDGMRVHCRSDKRTPTKYICTTVTSSAESRKRETVTYECCDGFELGQAGCAPKPTPASIAIDVGKSVEESFSSQFDEGNEETLERWRSFKWNRLR